MQFFLKSNNNLELQFFKRYKKNCDVIWGQLESKLKSRLYSNIEEEINRIININKLKELF